MIVSEQDANLSSFAADAMIEAILRDPNIGRSAQIERITALATRVSSLSVRSLKLIERQFIGIYGSEYLQNEGGFSGSLSFYRKLASIFPSDSRLTCYIANLLILNGEPEAAVHLYNQAFLDNPLLHYDVPGELTDYVAVAGDSERIKFGVTLIQCYVLDGALENGDEADLIDMYRELVEEFGEQHPVLQELLAIDRIHHDLLPILEKYAKKS